MLKVRIGAYPAEAVLVTHGVCADGSRVVLGLKWRGLRMDDELRGEIDEAKKTAAEKKLLTIKAVDNYLEAA